MPSSQGGVATPEVETQDEEEHGALGGGVGGEGEGLEGWEAVAGCGKLRWTRRTGQPGRRACR